MPSDLATIRQLISEAALRPATEATTGASMEEADLLLREMLVTKTEGGARGTLLMAVAILLVDGSPVVDQLPSPTEAVLAPLAICLQRVLQVRGIERVTGRMQMPGVRAVH